MPPPSHTELPDFDLKLVQVEGSGPRYEVTAELRSALLDPAMHQGPGATVVAIVGGNPANSTVRAVLDPFQVESIAEYLRVQAHIRQTVESELIRYQHDWEPDGE